MSKRTAPVSFDSKERFFSRLPSDSFTEYENEVLNALQLLADLMSKWFPRSVSLQEWAERRIPAHLASSVNGSGIIFVEADRSDADQDALGKEKIELHQYKRRRTEVIEGEPEQVAQQEACSTRSMLNKKGNQNRNRKHVKQHAQQEAVDSECFEEEEAPERTQSKRHESANDFLYEEGILRETIMQVLKKTVDNKFTRSRPQGYGLAQLTRLPRLNESFLLVQTVLPRKYHDIMDWAEDRAMKWFIVDRGHGETTISLRPVSEEARQARNEDLERFRERFFSILPEDRFTPGEETLREAILSYVDRWTGRGCAFYQKMCEDPSVRNAKYACVPPMVSLMAWCDKRMGAEVQFEQVEKGHLVARLPSQ